jgi:hypothetical protein
MDNNMAELEKLKLQLDVTFYAEVKMQLHMARGLPITERVAFIKSVKRFEQLWKMRDQYESTK